MKKGNAFSRRQRLFLAQDGLCAICGCQMLLLTFPEHPQFATFDHIVSIFDGGPMSAIGNLRLACRSCNMKRGADLIRERRAERRTWWEEKRKAELGQ